MINKDGYDGFILDVQIWNNPNKQARYLVHGIDDVIWTNSIDDVLSYLKGELERIELEKMK